jgi:predicted Rossmann-fold nucleotide-binding protein
MHRSAVRRDEIDSAEQLRALLAAGTDLRGWTLQAVDLRGVAGLTRARLDGCLFLGCTFADGEQEQRVRAAGGLVLPRLGGLPYDPHRSALYSAEELLDGLEAGGVTGTRDYAIYDHAHQQRRRPGGPSIREALAQRLHDHAIDDALAEFLAIHRGRGPVGIMGGHGTPRSDPWYARVARLAWLLGRAGYLVVTGGGPGIMEAGNLGAFLAAYADPAVVDAALELLRPADRFDGGQPVGSPGFERAAAAHVATARQVVERFGRGGDGAGISLAIPTWFYGHEPTNLFASAHAKYFDNSLREEGLLAVATAGVIHAPGSAGTLQEIFQDLCQNHYGTYGLRSPMVLFGSQHYAAEHALIQGFIERSGRQALYGDLLALSDEPEQAAAFIENHPPRPVAGWPPLEEAAVAGDAGPSNPIPKREGR